jgi:hypothetical protein
MKNLGIFTVPAEILTRHLSNTNKKSHCRTGVRYGEARTIEQQDRHIAYIGHNQAQTW